VPSCDSWWSSAKLRQLVELCQAATAGGAVPDPPDSRPAGQPGVGLGGVQGVRGAPQHRGHVTLQSSEYI
jgi:hypothetical protein